MLPEKIVKPDIRSVTGTIGNILHAITVTCWLAAMIYRALETTHPRLAGVQVPEFDVSVANCHKTAAIF